MNSNEPVKNGCEVIYEMFHISLHNNHNHNHNALVGHCTRIAEVKV